MLRGAGATRVRAPIPRSQSPRTRRTRTVPHPIHGPGEITSTTGYGSVFRVFCNAEILNSWMGKKKNLNWIRGGGGLDFSVLCSILLHLPPLRFLCVGECWDRTQDSCDFRRSNQSARSHPHSARSHPIGYEL